MSTVVSAGITVEEIGSGSVTWNVKNWARHLEMLTNSVGCDLAIGINGGRSAIRIRFSFVPIQETFTRDGYSFVQHSLSLWAEVAAGTSLIFDFDVKRDSGTKYSVNARLSFGNDRKVVVDKHFLPLRQEGHNGNFVNMTESYYREQELKIEIKVTLLNVVYAASTDQLEEISQYEDNGTPDVEEPADIDGAAAGINDTAKEASMTRNVKLMYSAENNFPDLKMETKDNMTLSGHRFMLAARSPVLRKLIELESSKADFSGIIQLGEVNAKPMMAVIHWMYSEELHENVGRVMEEVVDICVKFEIPDLLNILDKKLITICDIENMFQLFQVAKKNGMKNATADISGFIKQNI